MRATFFLVGLAGLVSAAAVSKPAEQHRGLSDFPKCAVPCLLKAPRGNCGITNYHCLCHNDKFIKTSESCIYKTCKGADIGKAKAAQAKTCKGQ